MVANPNPLFWSKVDKNGPIPEERPDLGPCWVWTSSTTNGYGRWKGGIPQRSYRSHRYAWAERNGPIPDGLEIDHLCFNRRCVNPDHLEAVTRLVNIRRRRPWVQPERWSSEFCKHGHRMDEANTSRRSNRKNRECRTCIRMRHREAYRRKRSSKEDLVKREPFIDETGDVVFFGEPNSTRKITLKIVGHRKGEPLLDPDEFATDTDVPMTMPEMAAALRNVTTPVAEPDRPLSFDPDDYPFR